MPAIDPLQPAERQCSALADLDTVTPKCPERVTQDDFSRIVSNPQLTAIRPFSAPDTVCHDFPDGGDSFLADSRDVGQV
jgi:hypothetical protein